MDKKRQRKLSRLTFIEDLRVALPIIAMGLAAFASLVYVVHIGIGPTVHATCRYQYFVMSPNKFSAGSAVAICKLPNGGFASVTEPVGWTQPDFDSETYIIIPK